MTDIEVIKYEEIIPNKVLEILHRLESEREKQMNEFFSDLADIPMILLR